MNAETGTLVISVTNDSELRAALDTLSAGSGGEIRLAPGTYWSGIGNHGSDHGPITVTSADPDNPATIARISISNSKNITVTGVKGGVTNGSDDMRVYNNENVTISNVTFESTANGFYDGEPGDVRGDVLGDAGNNVNFTFENNVIKNYSHGLLIEESVGTVVRNNTFEGIVQDGIRMVGVQDTLIEANHFQHFHGSTHQTNHDDMIQVWSTNADSLTENLVIRGNFLDTGNGAGSQSIFIRNEKHNAGQGPMYRDILIEDNVVYNGHAHGIAISGTDGVVIRNNTVLWNPLAEMQTAPGSEPTTGAPQIRATVVANAEVYGNIAAVYALQDDLTAYDNGYVSYGDPYAANHVSRHFVNVEQGGPLDLRDFQLREDSWLVGRGAPASQPGADLGTGPGGVPGAEIAPADGPAAQLRLTPAIDDPREITFDAGLSRDTAGLTARWRFEDGATAEGWQITRAFAEPGLHPVTLELVDAAGDVVDAIDRQVWVRDPLRYAIDFEDGIRDASAYTNHTYAGGGSWGELIVEDPRRDGKVFQAGGDAKLFVSKYEPAIQGLTAFSLGFDVAMDNPAAGGILVKMHKTMELALNGDGSLRYALETGGYYRSFTSAPGVLSDTDWHRIELVFDGASAAIWVDGSVVAETDISGITRSNNRGDLVFGHSFGGTPSMKLDDITLLARAKSEEEILRDAGLLPDSEPRTDPPAEDPVEPPAEEPVEPPADEPVDEAPTDPVEPPAEAPVDEADVYAGPGYGPDGTAATRLAVDFEGGVADDSVHDSWVYTRGGTPAEMLVTDDRREGTVLQVGGDAKLMVTRYAGAIQGLEAFTLGFDLARAVADDAGAVVKMHKTMEIRVLEDGALRMALETSDGYFAVQSAAGVMADTDWQRIDVVYDGSALTLYRNGEAVATGAASGRTDSSNKGDLTLGHPWEGTKEMRFDDLVLLDRAVPEEELALWDGGTPAPAEPPAEEPVDETPTDPVEPPADEPPAEEPVDEAPQEPAEPPAEEPVDETPSTPDAPGLDYGPDGTETTRLWLDFEDGIGDGSVHDSWVFTRGGTPAEMLVTDAGRDGTVLQVGGDAKLMVSRYADAIQGLDAFTFGFDVARGAADDAGAIVKMHKTMEIGVEADGALRMVLETSDGFFAIESDAGLMDDTDWQRIDTVYDGSTLTLFHDGVAVAEGAVTGTTTTGNRGDLTLGHPWESTKAMRFDDVVLLDEAVAADTFDLATEAWADVA